MVNDSYMFDGKGYESVPRALFLDKRLTPIERNAWQVLKMLLEADGVTSLSTYEQLQPYLTTSPLTGKASTETIARALTLLRLTGWLSLTNKRRHDKGTVQGNVYLLHEEPLSIYERLQTDVEYLVLLSNATTHNSKTIQKVAEYTLEELINDPYVVEKRLPTRLEILTERLKQCRSEKLSTTTDSEDNQNDLLRSDKPLKTESKTSLKRRDSNRLRHRNKYSSSKDKNILLQELKNNLKLPSGFLQLSLSQQENSLLAISVLDTTEQQQVLDEWQQRCEQQTIRNPAAYLQGIIQKALQGELNLLRSSSQPVSTQSAAIKSGSLSASSDSPTKPDLTRIPLKSMGRSAISTTPVKSDAKPTDSVTARGYLKEIKQMLKAGTTNRSE